MLTQKNQEMTVPLFDQLPFIGKEQTDGSLKITETIIIPNGLWERPNYYEFLLNKFQPEPLCAEIILGLSNIDIFYQILNQKKNDAINIQKISGSIKETTTIIDDCNDVLKILLDIYQMIHNGCLSKEICYLDHSSKDESEVTKIFMKKSLFRPFIYYNVSNFMEWAQKNSYKIPTELNIDRSNNPTQEKEQQFEKIVQAIKINYVNDSEIKIKFPDRPIKNVTSNTLGFKNNNKSNWKSWKEFIDVLQDFPVHYYTIDNSNKANADASRKRMYFIGDKLKNYFCHVLQIDLPKEFKVYYLVKGKAPGTYKFKFTIEYLTNTNDFTKKELKKEFNQAYHNISHDPDNEDKQAIFIDMCEQCIEAGVYSKKQIDIMMKKLI